MIFPVIFVGAIFVHGIAGLLNGNVHTGTTSSPDGAVLHQTLAQLVVELEKRVNDLQTKVNTLETEKQNNVVLNTQLKTELSTQGRTLESLQRVLHQQIASVLSLQTKEEFYNVLSSQLNDSLQNLTTDHEKLKSKVDVMKNLSIMPMKNDINNMQGHINDILAAQGSLSGNLSHVQNDLHDLYECLTIQVKLIKRSQQEFTDMILVPYRTQSTDARAQVVQPGPREPYSPHQHPENNMDFVMARADDLLNWGRRSTDGLVDSQLDSQCEDISNMR
eukprot:XP_011438223.1 PREDICTED: uncharacterized protein LOC105335815 [Crassostrea gigas]